MRKARKVAMMFPLGVPHIERLTRGIMDYASEHGGWTFVLSSELRSPSLAALERWDGHGAFCMLDRNNATHAARLSIPLVNLSARLRESERPRVRVDDRAAGTLAARHLLQCGFRRFAYYGFAGGWYSEERGRGFVETIETAGWPCSIYTSSAGVGGRHRGDAEWEKLGAWLRSQKPPFGLMACYDQWAAAALEACQEIGLRVPDDAAVIGVNNDEITCEYCHPKLSSVARPDREIGYQAAAMLDRLMAGRKLDVSEMVLPPAGLMRRESTDVLAVESEYVKKAVHFIGAHVHEGIGVQHVLKHAAGSRRLLEYRFREHIGRTPHQYLCDVRVAKARRMLDAAQKIRLKEIAAACGFHDLQRFRLVFKRLTGLSPRQYRAQAAGQRAAVAGGMRTEARDGVWG